MFPSILKSFANLFRLIIDKIYIRFKAIGSKGLSIALVEGVVAFNRISSYYFTSYLKLLIGSILRPLGAIDSIKTRV